MQKKILKVTMLGPRGVGKTSVLAGIYDQFERVAKATEIDLTPDRKSSSRLGQKLGELKAQTKTFNAAGGIVGTADVQTFLFDLGLQFEDPEMHIEFRDYPGGWLSGDDTDKLKRVEDSVHDSQMIILAVDTPALIEQGSKWNELINKPREVSDFFKRAFRNMTDRKLLLIVPMKCESYVQREKDRKHLVKYIKDSYEPLLSMFQSDALVDRLSVVITPIQTLGNVRFSHYKIENGLPTPSFNVSKNDGNVYDPKDVEQVIFYMLNFVFNQHLLIDALQTKEDQEASKNDLEGYLQGRSFARKFLDAVIDVDQDKREELETTDSRLQQTNVKLSRFEQGVAVLSGQCKFATDGFDVLQGRDMLALDEQSSKKSEYVY